MKNLVSILLLLPLIQVYAGGNMRKVVDLNGYWKFSIGDNPRWSEASFNDIHWDKIQVPSTWEEEGYNGFDGYAWYRTNVDLKNIDTENLYLNLGYIDDVDEVYINGELMAFSGSFPPNFQTAYQSYREYYIPPSLLNPDGKNVIAIRVYDTVREGGIVKGDIGLYTPKDQTVTQLRLEGIWKFNQGDNWEWRASDFDDSNWLEIMVPGFWGNIKQLWIRHNIGWYRKKFILPEGLKNDKEIVLIVGLIDDFDKTYLNGQLIGYTNDGLPFGQSSSYRQYRIYVIPNNLLKKEGVNNLAVRVRDMGGEAGIYKGPISIVSIEDYERVIRDY